MIVAREDSLLLLRHGESTWNARRLWQGWSDPPLTDAGIKKAEVAAELLGAYGFVGVCCSDLARARQTAEIVAAKLGLDSPAVDRRLRERDVGEWAGLNDHEIEARWPGQLAAWRACDDGSPAGGGEDSEGVVSRMQASLLDIWSAHDGQRLAVVSHTGAIRALDRALGGEGAPIPNLGGLWFRCDGESLRVGDAFDMDGGERTGSGRL